MGNQFLQVVSVAFFVGQSLVSFAQLWGAESPKPFISTKDSLKKGEFTWAPIGSPAGLKLVKVNKEADTPETLTDPAFLSPVTVQVSREDKRMIVLRDGIEIGRCKVGVRKEKDSMGTYAFGMNIDVKHDDQRHHVQIPEEFLNVVTPVVSDGTTMVIADAPVVKNITRKEISVIISKQV